ncbi:hypothetical protein ACFX2C_003637 [Malus domestica]
MEPKASGKNCGCRPERLTQSRVVPEASCRIPATFSTMVEETTFPVDLTKTRFQLHGDSVSVGSTRSTNAFWVTLKTVQEQGPMGLYKGLSPVILRHLFYTSIRIIGYE